MLNKLYPPLKDPHVCYLSRTAFMAMLVFKNGSLCREKIRDAINESTSKTNCHCATDAGWAEFDRLLASSSARNNGFIGIFFHEEEITPKATGLFRFDAGGIAKNPLLAKKSELPEKVSKRFQFCARALSLSLFSNSF